MLTFSIENWQAWAPGLVDKERWHEWAVNPYCPYSAAPGRVVPDTSFLPALQRRRLSSLARMAFDCAWPLADALPPMPVVFASRHGETTQSFALLNTLAQGESLSPTAFGLSVHNAIMGQWSIIRKEPTEGVALAGDADMLEHAFIEACMLLCAGAPRVLVMAAEEAPPAEYRAWIDDVPFSYAVAFRVAAEPQWQLSLGQSDAAPAPASAGLPHPLNLVRQLLVGASTWQHRHDDRLWHWRRRPS